MLFAGAAVMAGILAAWAAGRHAPPDPWAAAVRGWRWPALLGAGVVLMLAGQRWIPGLVGLGLLEAGYVLALVFAAANLRRAGLVLIGLGLLANLAVIGIDWGMPVRGLAAAVPAAGHHHGLSSRDHLAVLTDDLRPPGGHETLSPGDILLALGGAVAVFFWLEPRPRRPVGDHPAAPRSDRSPAQVP
jgi:hypothetical protein